MPKQGFVVFVECFRHQGSTNYLDGGGLNGDTAKPKILNMLISAIFTADKEIIDRELAKLVGQASWLGIHLQEGIPLRDE